MFLKMNLEPPDTHHLAAAMGWLELGNPSEAGQELARLAAASLEHPDVLSVRWEVCAATRSWDAALEVAEILTSKFPERASGWIHRAYALRRAKGGGLAKAWDVLRPAFERFPKETTISFNLACYAAQLGRLEEAMEWLHTSMEAEEDVARVKQRALADPDLQPLWERIREW